MKQGAMLIALSGSLLLLAGSIAQKTQPAAAAPLSIFNAQRLRTGTFSYRDLDHGKEVGRGTITIQRLTGSQDYQFSNEAIFAESFSGFRSQRWEAVTTSTFAPVSATLTFGTGPDAIPIFNLQYTPGRVTGFAVDRKGPTKGTKHSVDAAVPADIVDQRIDWAAVLASDHHSGRKFEFHVYDPAIGTSRVIVQVGSSERVQVPAGTFETYKIIYRIEKTTGTEEYRIFASRDRPSVLVREEFPNGVMSELVKIAEIANIQ